MTKKQKSESRSQKAEFYPDLAEDNTGFLKKVEGEFSADTEGQLPKANSQKPLYEVHIRAVKTKVPTATGMKLVFRGDVISNPTDQLIALAKADKNCNTLALIKKQM